MTTEIKYKGQTLKVVKTIELGENTAREMNWLSAHVELQSKTGKTFFANLYKNGQISNIIKL